MKNFLAAIIDIFILLIYMNISLKLNNNIFHLKRVELENFLGIFTLIYFGIIPYYFNKRTFGEILVGTKNRIENLNLMIDKNSPKFFKMLGIFFNRLFLFLMDITGLNIIKYIYQKIFRKKS